MYILKIVTQSPFIANTDLKEKIFNIVENMGRNNINKINNKLRNPFTKDLNFQGLHNIV